MNPNNLGESLLVELPEIYDIRGSLTFIEGCRQIPFPVRRVYFLYDLPVNAVRAGHAHIALQQLLIAVSGSFDVTLDDGSNRMTFTLNRPSQGLIVPPLFWRDIASFSIGAVCLALASEYYDECDYIRSYDKFLEKIGS